MFVILTNFPERTPNVRHFCHYVMVQCCDCDRGHGGEHGDGLLR